jgi:NAD(P)-dependent dehydrogenase (short-subunit alcohol dehydrogenase family)
MNNGTFTGKVALVTGGTSGIGKATAVEFARHGAKVVLSGRREKEGAQVVAEIKKLGGEAAFVRADVAKEADVKAIVKFAVDKFGRLDIAFNNPGVASTFAPMPRNSRPARRWWSMEVSSPTRQIR